MEKITSEADRNRMTETGLILASRSSEVGSAGADLPWQSSLTPGGDDRQIAGSGLTRHRGDRQGATTAIRPNAVSDWLIVRGALPLR